MRKTLGALGAALLLAGVLAAPARAASPDPRHWAVRATGTCFNNVPSMPVLTVNPIHGTTAPAVLSVPDHLSRWATPAGWTAAGRSGDWWRFITDRATFSGSGRKTAVETSVETAEVGLPGHCLVDVARARHEVYAGAREAAVLITLSRHPRVDMFSFNAKKGHHYALILKITAGGRSHRYRFRGATAYKRGINDWRFNHVRGLKRFTSVRLSVIGDGNPQQVVSLQRLARAVPIPTPVPTVTAPASTPTPTPTPSPTPTTAPSPCPTLICL